MRVSRRDFLEVENIEKFLRRVKERFVTLTEEELRNFSMIVQPEKNSWEIETGDSMEKLLNRELNYKHISKLRFIKGGVRFKDNRVYDYILDENSDIVMAVYIDRYKEWQITGVTKKDAKEYIEKYKERLASIVEMTTEGEFLKDSEYIK